MDVAENISNKSAAADAAAKALGKATDALIAAQRANKADLTEERVAVAAGIAALKKAEADVDTAFGYTGSPATSDATVKVNETAKVIEGTFGEYSTGNVGPFSKLGANLPSISSLTNGALKLDPLAFAEKEIGGVLSQGVGGLLGKQVNSFKNNLIGSFSARSFKADGNIDFPPAHKVSLREIGGISVVEFEVLPEIVEQHQVDYEALAPAQFLGAFQKYKGTNSTVWTLNATLVSRTSEEASKNLRILNTLRGWTKPFFGARTGVAYPGKLGAPPPVLQLRGLRNLIGPVPVVITSLNWSWPRDVDYIPCEDKDKGPDNIPIPFPTVLTLPITLIESYSTGQFNAFNLRDYRNGNLGEAFQGPERVGGTEGAKTAAAKVKVIAPPGIAAEDKPLGTNPLFPAEPPVVRSPEADAASQLRREENRFKNFAEPSHSSGLPYSTTGWGPELKGLTSKVTNPNHWMSRRGPK